MFRQKIIKLVEKATRDKNVQLSAPENPRHGDYTTNVALRLKKNPQEIIELLTKELEDQKTKKLFEKIEAAGPGFINFYLSEKCILDELNQRLKELSLTSAKWQDKKVAVEFTDPNPFKEFHIGHLYSNIVGETICRLLEVSGALVKRMNYQGDVGLHTAKAVWGMRKKLKAKNEKLKDLGKKSLEERIKFMGESYAEGSRAYQESEEAKKEITELNKKIFALDPDIKEIYTKGRSWSLKYFDDIYQRLGTTFDFYYFESQVGKTGRKLVEKNLKKGVFEKSQGAVVFPGEKYGLHSRVFINSAGLPTYEAKELGLAPKKYKDFPYDLSIIVTGNEIVDYFKVLIAALKIIYPDLGKKTLHIGHGMVRLKTGKMSSRTGKVITAEDLLNQVKQKALERNESQDVAEKVALGAVKYSLLRVGLGKDIIFDINASLSLEGDTGPYLQYTHARLKSILRKVGFRKTKMPSSVNMMPLERRLSVALLRFPEVLQDAADSFSPNVLATYLRETASLANEFYHAHPVAKETDKGKKSFRIGLVQAAAEVLKNGLNILGIAAPEKM